MAKKEKIKFLTHEPLDKYPNAHYYWMLGERSNGKTYVALNEILKDTMKGNQGAYIRRYRDDLSLNRARTLFAGHVRDGLISKYTKGEWDDVTYYSRAWYFSRWDDELHQTIRAEKPFCYAFVLSGVEHDKSTSYPFINTIVFDEVIASAYLRDEFILFQNTISTIIRSRDGVKIYMLGNTINKFMCPYYSEMGLTRISSMQKGEIDVYHYGETSLEVVVWFTDSPNKKGKASDVYFAFDNPKLKMITNGEWCFNIYPHLRMQYKNSDIVFIYFIKFKEYILQCEIINVNYNLFTYIHRKTTPIKDEDNDIIYQLDYDERRNYHRNLRSTKTPAEKRISSFFSHEKVFYQDNEIGEIVTAYMNSCLSL